MLLNCLNSEGFVKTTLEQGIRLDGREAFQNRVTDIQFMDQHGTAPITQETCSTPRAARKSSSKAHAR